MHVIIRFANPEAEALGLGKLAGRFSFKTWATGETMVPEPALGFLAGENVSFIVEGRAGYERFAPLRNPVAAAV